MEAAIGSPSVGGHIEPNAAPLLVTVYRACELLSLSHTSIYELIAAGRLESIKVGRRRLIRMSSITALAAGAQ